MKTGKLVYFIQTWNGRGFHPWFWRMVGKNREPIGRSEGYLRKATRDAIARRLATQLRAALEALSPDQE